MARTFPPLFLLLTACGGEPPPADGSGGDSPAWVDTADSGPGCEETAFYRDADGDGYGDPDDAVWSCEAPSGYVAAGDDCDDADAAVNPGATEVCDDADADEDCDGVSDEPDGATLGELDWYVDGDGDGYGSVYVQTSCDGLSGAVNDGSDCDDSDADVHPAAPELCEDRIDNDCDGSTDEECPIDGLEDAVAIVAGDGGGFGVQVAGGDFTGDGIGDLLVGAYFVGANYEGGAAVFAGPLAGEVAAADAAGEIDGGVAEGALGWSVAAARDVDGDGVEDFLLGAPGTGGSSSSIPGYAYLVTASPEGGLALPADARAVFSGARTGANAGSHVAEVGDVDNDGVIDLLIGAQQAHDLGGSTGQAYLVGGDASGALDLGVDAETVFYGDEWAGGMGDGAASGDLTGDGISDVVLPANTSHTTSFTNGAVFVVSQPAAGVLAVDRDVPVYVSGDPWSGLGQAVAVGDWTGDGYADLAASDGAAPGAVYVLAGPLTGPVAVADAVASFDGLGAYLLDRTGWAIARADLDHDGADDLAIGSPHIDVVSTGPGALDVFYGPLTGGAHSLSSADVAVAGTTPDALGIAVVAVGDTTADGREELAATSIYRGSGAGAVWLFE